MSAPTDLSKERLRLWLKLLKASGLIEEEIRRRLRAECRTTLPRFDVMSALSRSTDGLKMSEISRMLRVSNGNITGIVDKLADEGLVRRVEVPGDRRISRVVLTKAGRAEFEAQAKAHETWVNGMLSGLGEGDLTGMIQRLDHLTQGLEEQVYAQ